MWVPTNVIWKPHTKKPKTNNTYPLWEKASLIADKKVWSLSAWYELITAFDGNKKIEIPKKRRVPKNYIEIIGAREQNLKNIDVKINDKKKTGKKWHQD